MGVEVADLVQELVDVRRRQIPNLGFSNQIPGFIHMNLSLKLLLDHADQHLSERNAHITIDFTLNLAIARVPCITVLCQHHEHLFLENVKPH